MISFPNAKINLGLYVTGKRRDGYHNLESVFYPIPWTDILEIQPGEKLHFESSGLAIDGAPKDNLCVKAFKALQKDFGLDPVKIHLHKVIPMGAGLGGGSADASFVLRSLNELYNLYLEDTLLETYAAQIGSDCPFFIQNQPVLASGTGTTFSEIKLNLAEKHLIVVHPGIHIGTKEAYAKIKPGPPEIVLKDTIERMDFAEWRNVLKNDFEASIQDVYPTIASIKEQLYHQGAVYAAMTGSGSAVFGLFDSPPEVAPIFPSTYKVWHGQL